MAIISRHFNFLFCHMYKTGGNSLRYYLDKIPDKEEFCNAHTAMDDIKKLMIQKGREKEFNKLWKFAIVRNPYTWFLSLYYYIKRARKHDLYDVANRLKFEQFLLYIENTLLKRPYRFGGHNYFLSQVDYLSDKDGKLLVNYTGIMEDLQKTWDYIRKILKINGWNVIPKLNVSRNYDINNYQQYYSSIGRKFVERVSAKDLELFKYKF